MIRSAFCILLGLQLSSCMSINQTSNDLNTSSNSSICTQEWDSSVTPLNLCKFYNWTKGLFSLFRQTGEVVSEIEDTFGYYSYGDQVKVLFYIQSFISSNNVRFKSLLILRIAFMMNFSTIVPSTSKVNLFTNKGMWSRKSVTHTLIRFYHYSKTFPLYICFPQNTFPKCKLKLRGFLMEFLRCPTIFRRELTRFLTSTERS